MALVLAQKDMDSIKPVIKYDPISKKTDIMDIDIIQRILRKCRGSLMKFLNAKAIGVFITTKPGQQQLKASKKLQSKYPKKKFYYFLGNDLNMDDFENFPFIDMWINTACPRIGLDDGVDMSRGIVNLNEALDAEKLLSKESILTSI